MSAELNQHSWTEKSRLSGHLSLAAAGAVALIFTYFKLRPYLASDNKIHPYQGQDQADHRSSDSEKKAKEIKDSVFSKLIPIPHFGIPQGTSGAGRQSRGRVQIIERPLFDGLSVTIRAILLRGISSLESSPRIEARYESFVKEDETRDLDDSMVTGARLTGVAIANLDLKRLVLNFGELITHDGRSIPIQGTAIDPETQTQGVKADYASGLATRLFGVAISGVMTAGDQVLMAKVLPDPSTATLTQQATAQASKQLNDQAATDLSLEATKGLRQTKAELSLPAGTEITIRLRVAPQASQTGGGS
jgi:hypothetical protein